MKTFWINKNLEISVAAKNGPVPSNGSLNKAKPFGQPKISLVPSRFPCIPIFIANMKKVRSPPKKRRFLFESNSSNRKEYPPYSATANRTKMKLYFFNFVIFCLTNSTPQGVVLNRIQIIEDKINQTSHGMNLKSAQDNLGNIMESTRLGSLILWRFSH